MKNKILIISLSFCALLLGCQRIDSGGSDQDIKLSISARLGTPQDGSAAENQVLSLRLVIFSVSGSQVYNQLKTGADLDVLSSPTGQYTLNVTVPRKSMRVYLIANELPSWDLGTAMSETALKNLSFDHSVSGDIDMPFTMFANQVVDGDILTGDTYSLVMGLARNVVKVSLSMECVYAQVAGLSGGSLTVTQAYVENTPAKSFLGQNIEYKSSTAFVSAAKQNFTITPAGSTGFVTNELTFYIPEHIISQANVTGGNYTKLVIRGLYTPSGGSPIDIFYIIPLGNGISQWYQDGKIIPLTKDDLTVERNTHYNISARITSTGELDGLKLFVKVAPWEDGGIIGGDNLSPYLNISDLETIAPTRVYFWSNTPMIFVEENYFKYKKNGAWRDVPGTISEVFQGLVGPLANNFVLLDPSTSGQYVQYNGYMDLVPFSVMELNNYLSFNAYTYFSIMINAGGLKRNITVSVQRPSLLFDYNGGTSSDRILLANASNAENAYIGTQGETITLVYPPLSFAPPSAEVVFSHWNTSMDDTGVSYYPNETISLSAGVTILYAIYQKI